MNSAKGSQNPEDQRVETDLFSSPVVQPYLPSSAEMASCGCVFESDSSLCSSIVRPVARRVKVWDGPGVVWSCASRG